MASLCCADVTGTLADLEVLESGRAMGQHTRPTDGRVRPAFSSLRLSCRLVRRRADAVQGLQTPGHTCTPERAQRRLKLNGREPLTNEPGPQGQGEVHTHATRPEGGSDSSGH